MWGADIEHTELGCGVEGVALRREGTKALGHLNTDHPRDRQFSHC